MRGGAYYWKAFLSEIWSLLLAELIFMGAGLIFGSCTVFNINFYTLLGL